MNARNGNTGSPPGRCTKKISYLMDSVFAFTDLPIRLLIRVGGATAFLAGLFGLIVILARLLGDIAVPGYAATILSIVFFGAINLFSLGIVGSYAWRTYENTKARPLSVVLREHHFTRALTNGLKREFKIHAQAEK